MSDQIKINTKNEAGETVELDLSAFLSAFERDHAVPDFVDDDNPENSLAADAVVVAMYKLAVAGKSLPEQVESYSKYFDEMKAAVKLSDSLKVSKADAEKAKKEAAEKAKADAAAKKENEAKQLVVRRNVFLDSAASGVEAADSKFVEDLTGLKDSLPDGVKVEFTGDGGFGLSFAESVSEEDLATSLGYMFNAQEQNSFMQNAYQFFIGDIANELTRRGLYDSMIQCGKALEEMVLKKFNKRLSGRNVESYARMSRRIGIELRNPKADPTAYLAISDIPYTPKPTSAKFQEKEALKTALVDWEIEKRKIDEDRIELAKLLKAGKTTAKDGEGNEIEVEILARKDILPRVHKLKVAHGLAVDKPEGEKTVGDYMRQLAEAMLMKGHFLGVHKKGFVVVHPGNDSKVTTEISKAELETMIAEALNALPAMMYGADFDNLVKGKKTVQVVVTKLEKDATGKEVMKIQKDAQGNQVKEDKEEKVYPKFFSISI